MQALEFLRKITKSAHTTKINRNQGSILSLVCPWDLSKVNFQESEITDIGLRGLPQERPGGHACELGNDFQGCLVLNGVKALRAEGTLGQVRTRCL